MTKQSGLAELITHRVIGEEKARAKLIKLQAQNFVREFEELLEPTRLAKVPDSHIGAMGGE